jgi:catechol 2,3-dioxygenase-like lactoylglutathione lyase family enzyme
MFELKMVSFLSRDVAAARDFYCENLGAEMVDDRLPDCVNLKLGAFTVCIDRGDEVTDPRLKFLVDSIDEEWRRFDDLGLVYQDRPQGAPGSRWFSILDPEGRELIFAERL